MRQSIKVTMHIEACLLAEDKVVCTPLGDYSGLPWLAKNGDRAVDVHFENAYLEEEVLAPSFQNENMILQKGVHLHWIVPAFLGKEYDGKFNAAPNRWLVEKGTGQKWLVVSDTVHYPEISAVGEEHNLVINLTDEYTVYPLSRSAVMNDKPPFCYLGKYFPVDDQLKSEQDLEADSFPKKFGQPLTVLGFGHVQFSAFYPNCKTVFGFHDPEGKQGHTYQITGWHASETDDLLWKALQTEKTKEDFDPAVFLHEKYGLQLEKVPTMPFDLSKTLFIAAINIDRQPDPVLVNGLKIAVGNTASEAFSALIAQELSPSQALSKVKTEDQLEFFLMNDQLDGRLVDQVPKFLEARHRKGFFMDNGGSLFVFQDHFLGKTQEFKGIPLGEERYDSLNKLNGIKHQINELKNEIDSLKTQLYADWYKYMRAAYPPLGSKDLFPHRDDLAFFLQKASLQELEAKENHHSKMLVAERCLHSTLAKSYQDFLSENMSEVQRFIRETEEKIARPEVPATTDLTNQLRIAKDVEADLWQRQKALADFLDHARVQDALHLFEEAEAEKILDNPDTLKKYLDPDFPDNLILKEIAEPPFWSPTEPVIVVDGFKFGNRLSETACQFGAVDWEQRGGMSLPKLENPPSAVLLSQLDWCPFFMEWAVGLEDTPLNPTQKGAADWAESFFTNFYLDNDSPGVYRNSADKNDYTENDTYFQGGVILNPFMRESFEEGMKRYMTFCDNKLATKPEGENQQWSDQKNLAQQALTKIREKDLLCQRLSGFNQACLMFRQTAQLEMEEPLGFESSVAFSNAVAAKCRGHHQLSPLSLFDFLPIRNGKLVIQQLRFIDNFGIAKDLKEFEGIITADSLTSEELRKTDKINEYKEADIERLMKEIFLPPRLAQPARLNFHFLENDNMRMTENPNTTPVCGWLIPNFLNENIMVFSGFGQALGTLEKNTGWKNLPWQEEFELNLEQGVENTAFRMVIQKILDNEAASGGTFIDTFLSALQDGLANIAPEDFALQSAKVLLMGRPIAVARVRADLQIKGNLALDQSWQATMHDVQKAMALPEEEGVFLKTEDRFTGQWSNIDLPFRLGEHQQLNDGLLGYWVEKADGSFSEKFYAPQIDQDDSSFIASYKEGFSADKILDNRGNPFIHRLKPDGKALSFTVLLDPRGVLHATTGVLPTEIMSIPSESYQPALERMRMWFEAGPVLHYKPAEGEFNGENFSKNKRYLDLPQIADFKWKWFEKTEQKSSVLEVEKPRFDEIHEVLPEVQRGYLILEK